MACARAALLLCVYGIVTDAGRSGPIGCRVGESILHGEVQNLSRGSDTPKVNVEAASLWKNLVGGSPKTTPSLRNGTYRPGIPLFDQ